MFVPLCAPSSTTPLTVPWRRDPSSMVGPLRVFFLSLFRGLSPRAPLKRLRSATIRAASTHSYVCSPGSLTTSWVFLWKQTMVKNDVLLYDWRRGLKEVASVCHWEFMQHPEAAERNRLIIIAAFEWNYEVNEDLRRTLMAHSNWLIQWTWLDNGWD